MSDKLILQVWKNFPVSGASLNVLQAIAEVASDQGSVCLSMAQLASLSRLSVSTIFAAVKALRKDRWVVTDRIMGRGGVLIYQINLRLLERSIRPVREENLTVSERKLNEITSRLQQT
jgi:DNA-binding IclR family transcriptional regulator